ncbi:MAG: 3-phosphoserine/phosphohydroxythreonine transaminase [Erysipelotrichaceae bacterium]|nr:3-phosphoserine/phosphohydroxythreonine transaminase [Erysipelotrichaceae bacterium]
MYNRVYNFAAGPSQLSLDVLEEISKDLFNYQGTGMSVMEMSHRSKTYLKIFEETKATIKEVMNIPDNYEIIFMQGGATEQFSAIPLNLAPNAKADYIVTGSFAKKAAKEAAKFVDVNIACDVGPDYKRIPKQDELNLRKDADYVYICANNTIYGTEYQDYPDTGDIPLVADMSSDICSKKIDVSKFGLIYAGCQKNMGIAGLSFVIVRKDLIGKHRENMPVLMEYDTQVNGDSMYNTPNTFAIYVLGLVAKWIKKLGGLEAMEKRNKEKAKILYDILDNSDFYIGHADKDSRSMMNVTFNLPTEELEAKFVAEAKKEGMESLKGHRSVGGIRASIYNAMELEGIEKLAAFMKKFEEENR